MNDSQTCLKLGIIIPRNAKQIVATTHTIPIERIAIRKCFCLISGKCCSWFFGCSLESSASTEIPKTSAICFRTTMSGRDSERSHFETALSL